jgi:hypothetical protein
MLKFEVNLSIEISNKEKKISSVGKDVGKLELWHIGGRAAVMYKMVAPPFYRSSSKNQK